MADFDNNGVVETLVRARVVGVRGTGESDGRTEAGERNAATTDAEVFNDPFGLRKGLLAIFSDVSHVEVGFARVTYGLLDQSGLASHSLRDLLAGRFIGQVGRAAGGAGGDNRHSDLVTGSNGDVAERDRSSWEPFIPAREALLATLNGPGHAGLPESASAVAVDANPG